MKNQPSQVQSNTIRLNHQPILPGSHTSRVGAVQVLQTQNGFKLLNSVSNQSRSCEEDKGKIGRSDQLIAGTEVRKGRS
jgi:hypothetical protein